MSDFELVRTRLKSVSRECRLHLDRLNHARQKLADRFPLSVEDWRQLDDDTIADLDQLLFRLERLSIIPSAEQWIMLRELRSSAMHEYPDQPELTVANLNRIHDAAEPLERIFHAADRFASSLQSGTT